MTLAVEVGLVATPLAIYFYRLGTFHGLGRPKVVSGPVDLGWLLFGVGGMVAFGPVGQAIMARALGMSASPVAWALWGALIASWGCMIAGTARRRFVVYGASPDDFDRAYAPLAGSRDLVAIRRSRWWRTTVVEAKGLGAEAWAAEAVRTLRVGFERDRNASSTVSTLMFFASTATMLAGLAVYVSTDAQGYRAFRQMLSWFGIKVG